MDFSIKEEFGGIFHSSQTKTDRMWYRSGWPLGARPPVGALKWGSRCRQHPRPHTDATAGQKRAFTPASKTARKQSPDLTAMTQKFAGLSDSCNTGAVPVNRVTQQGAWPVRLGLTYASMSAGVECVVCTCSHTLNAPRLEKRF